MKRIGGLFEKIVDRQSLSAAAWRAALGKRQRPEVRAFLEDGDSLNRLAEELVMGTFRFSYYRRFSIRDPKTREIHAPRFRDRVVHHAMVGATGPVLESGATDRSYACRKGMGHHYALKRVRDWVRRSSWFAKVDIRKYYDSVPHAPLKARLSKRFRERRVLALFEALLDSYQSSPGLGLPIGALTSQYLGNFYLDQVDHWMLEQARMSRYVRYMDDMVFFGSKEEVESVSGSLLELLAQMELQAKDRPCACRCELGVPFLGFTLYPDRVRLDSRGRRRLRRRMKKVEGEHLIGAIGERELQSRSEALWAHARHADDVNWRRMVCGFSRIGDALESDEPRPARRLLEQYGDELPLGVSQQEQGWQSEQEQRVPALSVPRHEEVDASADVAHSRACGEVSLQDETMSKPSSPADICGGAVEKAAGEASHLKDEEL